jgi:hypothetical protein
MGKRRNVALPPGLGFWIFMACCALGAITLVALLVGGEVQGERVDLISDTSRNDGSGA